MNNKEAIDYATKWLKFNKKNRGNTGWDVIDISVNEENDFLESVIAALEKDVKE